jgi:2',3'-cyclic-nucleotide 2'-phosphodiesterase/3'-nucleotidase
MAQNELKNSFLHFDSAAGIIYEVDVTKPRGKRVSIKHMADGAPFDMEARYMVAMNSYRALGGGQLMTEGAGITYECLQ